MDRLQGFREVRLGPLYTPLRAYTLSPENRVPLGRRAIRPQYTWCRTASLSRLAACPPVPPVADHHGVIRGTAHSLRSSAAFLVRPRLPHEMRVRSIWESRPDEGALGGKALS